MALLFVNNSLSYESGSKIPMVCKKLFSYCYFDACLQLIWYSRTGVNLLLVVVVTKHEIMVFGEMPCFCLLRNYETLVFFILYITLFQVFRRKWAFIQIRLVQKVGFFDVVWLVHKDGDGI